MTLTLTSDVATILSNKSFFADRPHLRILPDLQTHLRKSHSILLKVHHDLIASGINRKSISLRTDSIYIDSVKHGSVVNNVICECSSTVVQSLACANDSPSILSSPSPTPSLPASPSSSED